MAAAHVTRAWLAFAHHLDWDRADHHFARALELAPNTADVHSRYALYLALVRRRFNEAVAESERAIELEPLSESDHTWLGVVLSLADRNPESIDRLLQAVTLDPTSWLSPPFHKFANVFLLY